MKVISLNLGSPRTSAPCIRRSGGLHKLRAVRTRPTSSFGQATRLHVWDAFAWLLCVRGKTCPGFACLSILAR